MEKNHEENKSGGNIEKTLLLKIKSRILENPIATLLISLLIVFNLILIIIVISNKLNNTNDYEPFFYSNVDLSNRSAQRIQEGFLVGIDKTEQQLNGINIIGKVINSNSVIYSDSVFKISFSNNVSQTFTIMGNILPGHSRVFRVLIPNLSSEMIRESYFEYLNGVIKWRIGE